MPLWECKMVLPIWITNLQFCKKLDVYLSYDPSNPLLRIHPEERKPYVHGKLVQELS